MSGDRPMRFEEEHRQGVGILANSANRLPLKPHGLLMSIKRTPMRFILECRNANL